MTLIAAWSLLPPEIENVALFLALGSVAAILFSAAKAGFGGSVGILAVPIMVLACGDRAALANGILLPMLIAADYVAVLTWWRRWDSRAVLRLLPGAAVGIVAAWAALYLLRRHEHQTGRQMLDHALMLAIGGIAIGFVVLAAVRHRRGGRVALEPTWAKTLLIGMVAGVTSTAAHAAGPVVAMYALALHMPKERYVATIALVFWALNHLKLPAYLHLGMINVGTVGATPLLVPAIAAGAVLGYLLHRRLGERQFTGVVYALLSLAAVGLIYKALQAMWP